MALREVGDCSATEISRPLAMDCVVILRLSVTMEVRGPERAFAKDS